MFNVELGDYGVIGIEYWVLARPSGGRTKPADNYVDSARPLVLTHNGQNQGEITGRSIKHAKDGADLPFLQTQGRLICHVNCDRLSAVAKRQLFASTREQSREGYMLERIRSELVGALKADDELRRLNEEAREQSLREKDEQVRKNMRRRVAKLLRIAGAALDGAGGRGGASEEQVVHPPRRRVKPRPIEVREPPTFLRIVWNEEDEIRFYPQRRRYLRVETDANAEYHDPDDPSASRLNVAVGDDLLTFGTSPLRGGRMRIGLECKSDVVVGSTGSIRVELYRKGLSALSDQREYSVVKAPEKKAPEQQSRLPDFEVIPVAGPEEENWEYISSDADDVDVSRHASNYVANAGRLYVYYSEAFPRFATEVRRFEQQNEALASSFGTRYETWVAVHSLLMYDQVERQETSDLPEAEAEAFWRQERARLAVVAVMAASQEVTSGVAGADDEAAVA